MKARRLPEDLTVGLHWVFGLEAIDRFTLPTEIRTQVSVSFFVT